MPNRPQFRSPYRGPYRPPYLPGRGGIVYEYNRGLVAGYYPGYPFGLGFYGDSYDDFDDSGDNGSYGGPDQYNGFDPQAAGEGQYQNPYPMQYSVSGPDQSQYPDGGQYQAEMQNQIPPGAPFEPQYGTGSPSPNPAPRSATPSNRNRPEAQEPGVTLVFKDGRPNQVIHNYLINANVLTVWDQTSHDIPIAQIDVEATRKINHEHGVEFFLPGTHF